jgi:hypothetical protein
LRYPRIFRFGGEFAGAGAHATQGMDESVSVELGLVVVTAVAVVGRVVRSIAEIWEG